MGYSQLSVDGDRFARSEMAACPGGTALGGEHAESRDGGGLPAGVGTGDGRGHGTDRGGGVDSDSDVPTVTFGPSSDRFMTGPPLMQNAEWLISNGAVERVGRATADGDAGDPPEDALPW